MNNKLIKIEKMNNGKDYGYVGQLTGTVYYSGTRFSCTWWQAQDDNRGMMELQEKEKYELDKEIMEAQREAYENSVR